MTADVQLAVIIGTHGLSGELRVKTFTETPGRLQAYGPVLTPEGRVLEIAAVRAVKSDIAIVRIKGIDGRASAEALMNTKLLVSRSALPATRHDEFYHADLIGLRAQDKEGRVIGEIRAIHNFGAGDVIEIARNDNSTLLLPFTNDFVPHISTANGYIVVAEPEDAEAEERRGVE